MTNPPSTSASRSVESELTYVLPAACQPGVDAEIQRLIREAGGAIVTDRSEMFSDELAFLSRNENVALTAAGICSVADLTDKTRKYLLSMVDGIGPVSLRYIVKTLASLDPPLRLADPVEGVDDQIELLDIPMGTYIRLLAKRCYSVSQLAASNASWLGFMTGEIYWSSCRNALHQRGIEWPPRPQE